MQDINKKVLKKYFEQIISGNKTYELRKIEEGEEYIVGETNFVLHEITDDERTETGRLCRCEITSFLPAEEINSVCGDCIIEGYAIIGIRVVEVFEK